MNGITRLPIWHAPANSMALFGLLAGMVILGIVIIVLLTMVPNRARRPIIAAVTFLCGLFYVLAWLWPKAQDRAPNEIPKNFVEDVAFVLQDGIGEVGSTATIITAFLLGLGAFSLLRIHGTKLVKQQKDWQFSAVLLIGMVAMIVVGYGAWYQEKFSMAKTDFGLHSNWTSMYYAKDLLFDGMLQKMDGAMFSLIAFYIISAAYRAFRVRSVEATILLAAALIMMLSLLALFSLWSNQFVDGLVGADKGSLLNNLRFSEIAGFVRSAFQSPALRGIDFGIGIGALAMGIRLWLSLEKTGAN